MHTLCTLSAEKCRHNADFLHTKSKPCTRAPARSKVVETLDHGAVDIHTGIFQGKIKNFPGLETPPVRSSDPTVQYSVGPMVRSYTRHVPILRTFFITEFRGSRSSGLTCQKKSKPFQGKNFPGQNFPGENFPGENFTGEQEKREKDTPKAFVGDARCVEDRYPGPRRGPLEVLDRLGRPESCGFEGSFWAFMEVEV